MVTLVPKKGKSKTILWPINDLSEGDHPIFALDIIDEGKCQKIRKFKPKEVTVNLGIINAKW